MSGGVEQVAVVNPEEQGTRHDGPGRNGDFAPIYWAKFARIDPAVNDRQLFTDLPVYVVL